MENQYIKQIFLVIDTNTVCKKLIFNYPYCNLNSFSKVTQQNFSTFFTEQHEYLGLINKENFFGYKSDFIANFFSYKNSIDSLEITIDNIIYIQQSITFKSKEKENANMNSLSIVVSFKDSKQAIVEQMKNQLSFFAKSLEFESKSSDFIEDQLNLFFEKNKVKKLFRNLLNISKTYKNLSMLINLSYEQDFSNVLQKITEFRHEIIKDIRLFQLCQDFFNSIKEKKEFFISNILHSNLFKKNHILLEHTEKVKPYQSIIISQKQCIRSLSDDSNQVFQAFIESLTPRIIIISVKSFQELAFENELSFEEVQNFVWHIQNFQPHQIISKIQRYSLFIINPDINLKMILDTRIAEDIQKQYHTEFYKIIKLFERPAPIKLILDNDEINNHNILIILLIRLKILKECKQYVYIKLPMVKQFKFESSHQREKLIYDTLQEYSLKPVTVQQISYNEGISLKEIFIALQKFNKVIGSYFVY